MHDHDPAAHPPWATVLALLLGACAGPQATPTSQPSSGVPTPDATVPTTFSVSLASDGPVIAAGDLGEFGAVLPGALARDADALHAWVVGFGAARGDQEVFHLTSPDGRAWQTEADAPLADDAARFAPPGPIPGSVMQVDDGSWAMWLWGSALPAADSADLWQASAPAPNGPWTVGEEPAVVHGDRDAWNGRGIDFPSVVDTGDAFLLAFGGAAMGSAQPAIGLATSSDGVTWQPQADPIIQAGFCGDLDARGATQPRLLRAEDIGAGDGFLIVYAGLPADGQRSAIGVARSADGATWECATQDPILVTTDIPRSQGIHTIAAVPDGDGGATMLIESLTPTGSELWLAELLVQAG